MIDNTLTSFCYQDMYCIICQFLNLNRCPLHSKVEKLIELNKQTCTTNLST